MSRDSQDFFIFHGYFTLFKQIFQKFLISFYQIYTFKTTLVGRSLRKLHRFIYLFPFFSTKSISKSFAYCWSNFSTYFSNIFCQFLFRYYSSRDCFKDSRFFFNIIPRYLFKFSSSLCFKTSSRYFYIHYSW